MIHIPMQIRPDYSMVPATLEAMESIKNYKPNQIGVFMAKYKDIAGERFGRLLCLKAIGKNKKNEVLWLCRCDCGNMATISGCSLRRGFTKSCGCLRRERMSTHELSKTKSYGVWEGLKQRCDNFKNAAYERYGGRGITICERWRSFENFFKDMGEKPEGLSLERRDNNCGYSKENCYWANPTEQARNQRVQKNNKTGVKGVGFHAPSKKYIARITVNYKTIHLGYFEDLNSAVAARKTAEKEYWGEL